MMYAEVWYLV